MFKGDSLILNKMKKKHIFVQDCGILNFDIVVLVGVDEKYFKDWSKKNRKLICKEEADYILENIDFTLDDKNSDGFLHYNYEKGYFVLVTKEAVDEWDYWTILLHEITHAAQHLSEKYYFKGEREFEAYMFEYLFKNIRRKISGVTKYK